MCALEDTEFGLKVWHETNAARGIMARASMNVTILLNLSTLFSPQWGTIPMPSLSEEPHSSQGLPSRRSLNYSDEQLGHLGFSRLAYKTTTEDGYVLSLTRVVRKPPESGSPNGFPVLLVNGFIMQSDGWLALGNDSLPIILANHGYDVWLGDQRGSARSMTCLNYSWDDKRAHDYSFHEQGVYDLPAFIDAVLQNSRRKKVLYVGYSLSGGMFIVMNSERPAYNKKVMGAALLAPAAHLLPWRENEGMYRIFLATTKLLVLYYQSKGLYQFPGDKRFVEQSLSRLLIACNQPFWDEICGEMLVRVYGKSANMNPKKIFLQLALALTPVSTKTGLHLLQLISRGRFSRYDYGKQKNIKMYGKEEPPDYQFKNTKVPTMVFSGGVDKMVSPKAAKQTCEDMGKNCIKMKRIPDLNHADFVFGESSAKTVYKNVVNFFDRLTRKARGGFDADIFSDVY